MKLRRLYMLAGMAALIAVLVSGFFTTGIGGSMSGTKVQAKATATPPPFPDAYKLDNSDPSAPAAGVVSTGPLGLDHPCSSLMVANPPFVGLSPIAIAYPRTTCTSTINMGDVATWQNNGHDYVGLSGFGGRMYFIYNVDDPYNPLLLKEQTFPTGGTASLSIADWKQNGNQYMSVSMRGTGTGCGWFAYNVNDPTNPVLVAEARNAPDWCTVHEHFVSLDANGNADYAWFTMSGESGSEGKIIAMDIRNLPTVTEVNRWDRDGDTGYFIHDSNVVRGKLYAAHWDGGMNIFDKAAFVSGATPVPLNAVGSIQPSGFRIHHVVPTSDDKYVLIQDEFINSPSLGKIKMYDIQNIASPQFVTEIVGGDAIANSQQAHNMIIKPLSPGIDLLFNAWYKAGIRGYKIDTTQATPTITQVFRHQLALDQSSGFGNVWGVDYLPCTLRGLQRTCMYAGDMRFGLIVNAVNTDTFMPDPSLDPYAPAAPVITSPVEGQNITTCAISITGTATDYWSGLNRVEVSTDNGGTWSLATGTTNWTYQWNNPSSGAHVLKARAYDMADNMTISALINVTVSATCPLTTPTALPTNTMTAVPTFTPQPPCASAI
ncbi:MAG: Ig-like domain-containing protein [Chloroflexia bacterium]